MNAEVARQGVPVPRVLLFLLAWTLSGLPLLASGTLEFALGDASRSALAWTPWIALIGLPAARPGSRDWPLALGLALPVIAAAIWLDLRAGLGQGRLEETFAGGLLAFSLLGEARTQAARGEVRTYAPVWFGLVALLPALALAIAWGSGGRVFGTGLAAKLASASPITALWRDVRPIPGDLGREGLSSALFCPSTAACLVLFILVSLLRRHGRGGPA